jgi:hypothetical protein
MERKVVELGEEQMEIVSGTRTRSLKWLLRSDFVEEGR